MTINRTKKLLSLVALIFMMSSVTDLLHARGGGGGRGGGGSRGGGHRGGGGGGSRGGGHRGGGGGHRGGAGNHGAGNHHAGNHGNNHNGGRGGRYGHGGWGHGGWGAYGAGWGLGAALIGTTFIAGMALPWGYGPDDSGVIIERPGYLYEDNNWRYVGEDWDGDGYAD